MKHCVHCGNEIDEAAMICPKCGCAVEKAPTEPSGIQTAARVFMIIGTIVNGVAILPLLWCIPMTSSYSKKIKSGEKIETGFKICSLLFVNLVAGILMLCDSENQ